MKRGNGCSGGEGGERDRRRLGEETRRENQREEEEEEEECGVPCFVRPVSLLCLPFRSPRPTPTALSSTDDYLLLYACVALNRPPLLFLYVPDPSTPPPPLLPPSILPRLEISQTNEKRLMPPAVCVRSSLRACPRCQRGTTLDRGQRSTAGYTRIIGTNSLPELVLFLASFS